MPLDKLDRQFLCFFSLTHVKKKNFLQNFIPSIENSVPVGLQMSVLLLVLMLVLVVQELAYSFAVQEDYMQTLTAYYAGF